MSLITMLPEVLEQGRIQYDEIKAGSFQSVERVGRPSENLLVLGDNLAFMKYLMEEKQLSGKIKLVYIDPPFFSKANYDAVVKLESETLKVSSNIKLPAYGDIWEAGLAGYLIMLTARFYMIKDLLAEDGCFWIHLDWHVVHPVKIILDEIFGEKNFVNEVIWNYKSGGTSKRHFSRKHDTLLFYGKTSKYYFSPQKEKSYNRGYKPYRFSGVKEYKDDLGWYTMVNMKDVWSLDMVGRTSSERTGYATQKPEALLERILESCSREGDLCVDFFGGSATLAATAHRMGRNWISCDIGAYAIANAHKRLWRAKSAFTLLEQIDEDKGTDGKVRGCDASVHVGMEILPLQLTDKKMIKIELLSYNLKTGDLHLDKKDEAIVKKLTKKDSLQLVDYWSVDFNYNGEIHNPELVFSREKGICQYSCEKLAVSFDRMSLRVVDVFGNCALKIYDLQGVGK